MNITVRFALDLQMLRRNAPETSVSIVSLPGAPELCVKHFKNRGTGYLIKGIFRRDPWSEGVSRRRKSFSSWIYFSPSYCADQEY